MTVALTEAKVQSEIFPDFDSSVNFFSGFYNHDTRSEFKIHYDKRITLCGNQPSVPSYFVSPELRFKLKGTAQFYGGSSTQQTRGVYLLISTDVSAPYPTTVYSGAR